jgi:hypothetical protein
MQSKPTVLKRPYKLKQFLRQSGITQRAFSETLGIRYRTFYGHLNGAGIAPATIVKYKEFFNENKHELKDMLTTKEK